MNLRGLLARLGTWSRPRGPRNLWRALGDAFRAQDERAGRTRDAEGEETLRCGWSHLHPQGGDEDEPGRGRRER